MTLETKQGLTGRIFRAIFLLSLMLVVPVTARGQDGDSRKAKLNELQRLAEHLSITLKVDDKERAARMRPDPLLFYIDPARERANSGLWIWLHDNRPAALVSVSIWPPGSRDQRLRFEVASLVDEPVLVKRGEGTWILDEQHATRRRLLTEYNPSSNPRIRLQQFKRLATRFEASEDEVQGGPVKLRLLSTPIYELLAEDSPSGCAVFAFAHGTNPEVVLALEADARDPQGGWTYSLAAMAFASLSVSLDGEEVWTQPRYRKKKPRDMYYHGAFGPEVKQR